jgi:hypothetical protein
MGIPGGNPLLAGNFAGLLIFRLADPEVEWFDQVALFGVRKRIRGEHHDHNRPALPAQNRTIPQDFFYVRQK